MAYRRRQSDVAAIRFVGTNADAVIAFVADSSLDAEAELAGFGSSGNAVRIVGKDVGRLPCEERAWRDGWVVIERGRVVTYDSDEFAARFEECS